MKLEI
ncbi:hypothetical protein VCHENC02_0858A, partial [Vibrio harveyi]